MLECMYVCVFGAAVRASYQYQNATSSASKLCVTGCVTSATGNQMLTRRREGKLRGGEPDGT